MYQLLPAKLWVLLIWAMLIAVSLSIRPLMPVDETRYAAVAWEMWHSGDFLVPHLNGETYSHKPPLLFWLMTLGWLLLGVNDWSLRLVSPLFALAALFLSGAVARRLWPGRRATETLAPLILLGCFFWMVYGTLTMFDMMLAFFALLGMYSLLKLAEHGWSFWRWALLALVIGGGLLSKGPVILLHVLPAALLAPWWKASKQAGFSWWQWYGALVSAILMGAVIALCWAIPAGMAGGEAYRNAIFLGQTSGRLVKSFAHQLPWWWYVQMLPLLLLPWLLCRPLWAGLIKLSLQDSGIRFCLAWAVPVFIAFSLVSGKRMHYLLPLVPALALVLARAADEMNESRCWQRAHLLVVIAFALTGAILALLPWLNEVYHWRAELSAVSPVWGSVLLITAVLFGVSKARAAEHAVFYISAASVVATLVIACGFFAVEAERYDTKPPAEKMAGLMAEGSDIAFFTSKYHGQFHFTGRLQQPLVVFADFKKLQQWAEQHPNAYVLVTYKDSDSLLASITSYHYPYKSQNIGLLSCKTLLQNPELSSILKS
jgi:4-amino-4-deoxy-L-arabinose transferase-like glycosyltransferase